MVIQNKFIKYFSVLDGLSPVFLLFYLIFIFCYLAYIYYTFIYKSLQILSPTPFSPSVCVGEGGEVCRVCVCVCVCVCRLVVLFHFYVLNLWTWIFFSLLCCTLSSSGLDRLFGNSLNSFLFSFSIFFLLLFYY